MSRDYELIHRAAELSGGAERTDTQIIADWCRALDALFAHGVEHALPLGADPAPLDFDGIGNFPIFKLLEQHGTATADILGGNRRGGHRWEDTFLRPPPVDVVDGQAR